MSSQSDSDRDVGRSDRASSESTGQNKESIRLEFAVNYNGPDDLAKIGEALHREVRIKIERVWLTSPTSS